MSNFHKPKVYRSANGCCICKAKSSSSRFTDSKKYEPEFALCFRLKEQRSGEICNACVLLIKRWKKMPVGTTRNWHHIIDSRAGPGTKSQCKYKSKGRVSKRFGRKNVMKERQPESPEGLSDDVTVGEECLSDRSSFGVDSVPASLAPSPVPSEGSDDSLAISVSQRTLRYKRQKKKPAKIRKYSSFIDRSIWIKQIKCCGIVFVSKDGDEIVIDTEFYKPCRCKSSSSSEVSANGNSSNLRTKCLTNSMMNDEMSSMITDGDQPQPKLPQHKNEELMDLDD